jgi:hypothetical protein
MGSVNACPCGDRDIESLKVNSNLKKKKYDLIEEIMLGRLAPEDLMFEYSYDQTKIVLIKSDHVQGFCNNRNLFKMSKSHQYYNILFITNFLTRKDITMILLQNDYKKDDKKRVHMRNKDLISGLYNVESISVGNNVITPMGNNDKIMQKISEDI